MRISDWSSDVCASDLDVFGFAKNRANEVGGLIVGSRALLSGWRLLFDLLDEAEHFHRALAEQQADDDHDRDAADSELHAAAATPADDRSEEHTSELQSLMRISYAVFCLKKKKPQK